MTDLPISGIGAPILVLLALLSLTSIAIIIAKALSLSGATKGQTRRDSALKVLKDSTNAARTKLGTPETPADRVLLIGLSDTDATLLETTLEIAGNTEARGAFRHIRTLETIAMISPLLGLLGTVLGMIQAFRDLEMAQGAANASLLAGGIWQALLTTAAGLIVALPAAAAAALLSSRADAVVSDIEATISRLLATRAQQSEP